MTAGETGIKDEICMLQSLTRQLPDNFMSALCGMEQLFMNARQSQTMLKPSVQQDSHLLFLWSDSLINIYEPPKAEIGEPEL